MDTNSNPANANAAPIACKLGGLNDGRLQRQVHRWNTLKSQIREVAETPAGYAFRFDSQPEILMRITEIITFEMQCCPFLRFEIEVAEDGGPTWLRVSGREGVKEYLATLLAVEG